MENQPLTTIRSWFRRASSVAETEAAPEKTIAPVPEPAPAAPPEQILQSPAQLQPQPQPPPPQKQETPLTNTANGSAPESQQASPPPPSSSTPPATPNAGQLHTPQLSPNPEPEPKPMIAPNPEPEPEPMVEPQPKNIFMQRGSRKSTADIDEESRAQNTPRTNETSATSTKKDDGELKFITIAGENTGAYMELGTSRYQKHHKEKQLLQHNQEKENEADGEDGRVTNRLGGKKEEGRAVALVVNNNVQSVNNSILFGSSCGQRSPGVHIGLARQSRPNPAKGK